MKNFYKLFTVLLLLSWSAVLSAGIYSGGSGTSGDPYKIATLADLAELSATPDDLATGIFFIQAEHIDASATSTWNDNGAGGFYGFIPIAFGDGTNPISFKGSYIGDKHTITGLYINRLGEHSAALFDNGEEAVFLNIKLISPEIYGSNGTAGLIGSAYNTSITSCAVHGSDIQCAGEAESYGGLIGSSQTNTITLCDVTNVTINSFTYCCGLSVAYQY